jgi:hypothetical protein
VVSGQLTVICDLEDFSLDAQQQIIQRLDLRQDRNVIFRILRRIYPHMIHQRQYEGYSAGSDSGWVGHSSMLLLDATGGDSVVLTLYSDQARDFLRDFKFLKRRVCRIVKALLASRLQHQPWHVRITHKLRSICNMNPCKRTRLTGIKVPLNKPLVRHVLYDKLYCLVVPLAALLSVVIMRFLNVIAPPETRTLSSIGDVLRVSLDFVVTLCALVLACALHHIFGKHRYEL